jgi:hypothetical protein
MKVKVRIVGVYFHGEVEVDENATVWEITKAAETQSAGKLRIVGQNTIHSVEHDTDPLPEDVPTGINRAPGTYQLAADRSVRSRALVWQYYIQRPTGNFTGEKGDVPLYETVSADKKANLAVNVRGVREGDLILWRLLAIGLDPAGPISPPPAERIVIA